MGQARSRTTGVGLCVYCGATNDLSKEHVMPFGLGGDLVLHKASCPACRDSTSQLELKLLRGHWWPYRRFLGLPSRRPEEQDHQLNVTVLRSDGTSFPALLPIAQQSAALGFELAPPSILRGEVRTDLPSAARVFFKYLAAQPSQVIKEGELYTLSSDEKLNIPINFEAADLCRFLAKVAHCYAISRRGLKACSNYFLPPLILGNVVGAQTYVGGASSPFLGPRLPGSTTHALLDRVNGPFLSVYIQMFRDAGDPPPIYEVVVGKL